MRRLIALWRFARVLLHIARGAFTIRWTFPKLTQAQRDLRVTQWAQGLLGCMQIAHRVQGPVPQHGPVLLVANHISWLDIIVIHAAGHCRFVSKADVRHWPVVGMLAAGAGTLFIERESRRDAMRVVHHMAERLTAGDVLAVFPEGTTGDGSTLLPFHANLLQAAIAAQAPIQPLALNFVDGASGQRSFAPCYIGEDTLLVSLWRTLRTDGLIAELRYGTPQSAQGRERRQWAADLRCAIDALRSTTSASV